MDLYKRLFLRFRPKRASREATHLVPGIDVEGFVSDVFRRSPGASVITPDYHEPMLNVARGAALAPG
jgi:hypothetical protein